MAKKKNNKKNDEVIANCDNLEPVTFCDQSAEVVANSCLGKRPIGPSGDQLVEYVQIYLRMNKHLGN